MLYPFNSRLPRSWACSAKLASGVDRGIIRLFDKKQTDEYTFYICLELKVNLTILSFDDDFDTIASYGREKNQKTKN